ncbi:invasion associated locus B family protein [Chelativorans intermedius]|uniref:Invasion associated locus B family protein n=1 Tax=Chelativorans intermedius TaxID=515947 RepID=A0ABV6D706_9HYPH|nr:invasion associated locus B family protein [Chelativorans intermedius]MCT8999555.1 invasion associated locus B family protein [Chelativorans intermedius]
MMSLKARASRLAGAFLGALGVAAIGYGSTAHAQQEPPQGWFKACTKQEDVDVCNVQFLLRANTGQLLTSVNLIEIEGKVNRRVLQIAVPTGRLIPPGIGLQVDGGNTQKIDYAICVPDRCVAEAQLTDALISSFKRGSELTLTSVNFQNQPNPVKVTLQGFTDAYDGEPLQQSDLDERQKKLEEFVSKNNEEFVEKLKAAQERAKQAQ